MNLCFSSNVKLIPTYAALYNPKQSAAYSSSVCHVSRVLTYSRVTMAGSFHVRHSYKAYCRLCYFQENVSLPTSFVHVRTAMARFQITSALNIVAGSHSTAICANKMYLITNFFDTYLLS